MSCPRLDHFGLSVGAESELDDVLGRARAFKAHDDRVDIIDRKVEDQSQHESDNDPAAAQREPEHDRNRQIAGADPVVERHHHGDVTLRSARHRRTEGHDGVLVPTVRPADSSWCR